MRVNLPDGCNNALLANSVAIVGDTNINYGDPDSIVVSHSANVNLTFNTSSSVLFKSNRSFLVSNFGTSTVTLLAYNSGVPATLAILNPGKAVITALIDNPQTTSNFKVERLGVSGNQSDIYNLGITYAANTLTVTDSQGNALSATNPGSVTVPSTTAGQTKVLRVTSGGSFTTDQTLNWEWGITAGANWANDRPFFLYVVNKGNLDFDGVDGSSMFFISDIWNLSTTPAAAKCGDIDAVAGTDAQGSILIMDSVTEANYASLPCKLIGAFRMQYATATHKWTVQTLSNKDGIGEQALNATFATEWILPVGQMGAESGKHFTTADGATALTFDALNSIKYTLDKNGMIEIIVNLYHVSANGADGTNLKIALPYTPVNSLLWYGQGTIIINTVISGAYPYTSSSYGTMFYTNYINISAAGVLLDNQFTNANDAIYMIVHMRI